MKNRILLTFLLVACAALSSPAVPAAFTYRGRVGQEDGSPLADRSVAVTVRLYAGGDVETPLWGGVTNVVTDELGGFQVDVSDDLTAVSGEPRTKALATLLQRGEATHVGISFGNDPEIHPRQPFLTFPSVCEAAVAAGCSPTSFATREVRVGAMSATGTVTVTNDLRATSVLADETEISRQRFERMDLRQAARVRVFCRDNDCPYRRDLASGQTVQRLSDIFPADSFAKVANGGLLTVCCLNNGKAKMACATFPVAPGEDFILPYAVGESGSSYCCYFHPFAAARGEVKDE